MGTRHKSKHYFLAAALLVAIGCMALLILDTTITVGVDGAYKQLHMPLYVKWTQFLARHYEYARLAGEITADCRTDEEKVLAILAWTRENMRDVPPGMPVCDDHILYTIIRGYGVPEQFQDVFTTLCAYAGFPAFWDSFYDAGHRVKYALSLVKIAGSWRVFDVYRGIFFKNTSGQIASIDDIAADPTIVRGANIDAVMVGGVPYRDFYGNIEAKQIRDQVTLRPYRQMPLRRFIYELRKAFKIEND